MYLTPPHIDLQWFGLKNDAWKCWLNDVENHVGRTCNNMENDAPTWFPEIDDAWVPSELCGDFYREPDNVVRGASLAHTIHEVTDPVLTDDVVRSGFNKELHIDSDVSDTVHDDPSFLDEKWTDNFFDAEMKLVRDLTKRFTDDVCPSPPTDPFFRYEVTAIRVQCERASMLGNSLLDLLDAGEASVVTKMNHKKFTINASIFQDDTLCALKIRIFQQELQTGTYIVDVQRRSGDSVLFMQAYWQIFIHLLDHMKEVTLLGDTDSQLCAQIHAQFDCSAVGVQPEQRWMLPPLLTLEGPCTSIRPP